MGSYHHSHSLALLPPTLGPHGTRWLLGTAGVVQQPYLLDSDYYQSMSNKQMAPRKRFELIFLYLGYSVLTTKLTGHKSVHFKVVSANPNTRGYRSAMLAHHGGRSRLDRLLPS